VAGALLAPCAAAAFGRRRAPLVAAWAAIVTFFVVALSGPARAAFAGYQARGQLAARLTAAGDPVTLLVDAARVVLSRPCLLQAVLWAGLALTLAVALRLGRLEARLWLWALAFGVFYAVGRIVPVAVWGLPAGSHELLANVAVAAAASGAVLVLVAPPARHEAVPAGDPIWDEVRDDVTRG